MAKGGAFAGVPGAELADELLYVKLPAAACPASEKPVRDTQEPVRRRRARRRASRPPRDDDARVRGRGARLPSRAPTPSSPSATPPTTISPGFANGRWRRRRREEGGDMSEILVIPDADRGSRRAGPPTRAPRPGCRPMPARARPTCCRIASCACCSTASTAGPHPVAHLHQGGRRQHGEPGVRDPRRMGDAGRRRARRRHREASRAQQPSAATARAPRGGSSPAPSRRRAG